MFAYCGNNPVNRYDPRGCNWWDDLVGWIDDGIEKVEDWLYDVEDWWYDTTEAVEDWWYDTGIPDFVEDRFSTPERASNTFALAGMALTGVTLKVKNPKISTCFVVAALVCDVVAVIFDISAED